jgi:uncharacterized OsmC-like protein
MVNIKRNTKKNKLMWNRPMDLILEGDDDDDKEGAIYDCTQCDICSVSRSVTPGLYIQ